MNSRDRISGVFFVFMSLVIMSLSALLPLGSIRNPGPGAYPLILGVLLGIFSAALLMQQQRYGLNLDLPRGLIRREGRIATTFLLIFFLYIGVFEWLGFILSTFLFLFLMLTVIEKKSLLRGATFSALVTLAAYWIFARGLKVIVPHGLLG